MNGRRVIILISANSEWRAVKEILAPKNIQSTAMGEIFDIPSPNLLSLAFFFGGWGKISAAATTQYAIDHYHPDLLINLGTCGGFEGRITRDTILLVTKTIVYDIIEQMTDPKEAIADRSTELDLTWISGLDDHRPRSDKHPLTSVVRGLMVSGDRDIVPADIPHLVQDYGAVAADWESGAIAWVAKRNGVRCLILRGVTDLVSPTGGEAYGNVELYNENTKRIMKTLIGQLPEWLDLLQPSQR